MPVYQCSCKNNISVKKPGKHVCTNCSIEYNVIMPQEGPQTKFLSMRDVDIVGYGGAAGGGKTFAILIDPIPDINTTGFKAIYFRREAVQITNPGGLWDKSQEIFIHAGGKPNSSNPRGWAFPSGLFIPFKHLNEEKDKLAYQGAELTAIYFDELTHFTETQFWYLVSRNRTTSKVSKRIRATFNPDAGSWVKVMFAPWVDSTYPDPAKSGEVRWLVHFEDNYVYFKDKTDAMKYAQEVWHLSDEQVEHSVKSVSFIEADVYDNKVLMEADPGYLANLLAQPYIEQQRLLYKNWDILADRFFMEWQPKTPDNKPWHVIPTDECPKHWKYYWGIDYGFAAPWAAYLIGFDTDGRATVCREIYDTRVLASEQATRINQMSKANDIDLNTPKYAGFDVFAAQRGAEGQQEPIVSIWRGKHTDPEERRLRNIIESGRDPLARATVTREYLADWGPTESWPNGRPGLQVMECCKNFIRTMSILQNDKNRPEVVDSDGEDHAYDAVGHVLTSRPGRPVIKTDNNNLSPRTLEYLHQQNTSQQVSEEYLL